jgi:hypothetical protein
LPFEHFSYVETLGRGKVLVCTETLPFLQIRTGAETAIDITGQDHGSRRSFLVYAGHSSVYLFGRCFIAFRCVFGGDGGDSITKFREESYGYGVSSRGSGEREDADAARMWGGNVLNL